MEKDVTLKEVEEGVPTETAPEKEEPPEEQQGWWSHRRNQYLIVSLMTVLLAAAIALGALYGLEKSSSDDSSQTIVVTSFLNDCSELETQALPFERTHGDTSTSGQLYNFTMCEDGTGEPNYFGILYKWTGTGRLITADLCDERTSFDTYMSVYKCNDNGLLSCVTANNDMGQILCPDGDAHSLVQWAAEGGVQYYILVHGNGMDMTGDFELETATQSMPQFMTIFPPVEMTAFQTTKGFCTSGQEGVDGCTRTRVITTTTNSTRTSLSIDAMIRTTSCLV